MVHLERGGVNAPWPHQRRRSPVVEVPLCRRAAAAEERAGADEESADEWADGTRQGVHRDRACEEKPDGGAEHRRPELRTNDPTTPESNSCDEHRGEKPTEDSTRPETTLAERVTDHRSECAASPAERTGNQE